MTRTAEMFGVQEPQLVHLPPDVVSDAAAVETIEFAESFGLLLDASQQFTLHVNCCERDDGTWAATTAGDAVATSTSTIVVRGGEE